MFKHEINKLKEKVENIRWLAHYYDAEILVVVSVACVVALISTPYWYKP